VAAQLKKTKEHGWVNWPSFIIVPYCSHDANAKVCAWYPVMLISRRVSKVTLSDPEKINSFGSALKPVGSRSA